MKILKRPANKIFDTEMMNFSAEYKEGIPPFEQNLFLHHGTSDYEFLQEFFPLTHPIFKEVGFSYYYIL